MISNATNAYAPSIRSKKIPTWASSPNKVEIAEKKVDLQDCYIMKKTRLIRVKTAEEVKFLEAQFEKDPEWTRKTVQYCKDVLNLGTTQIYKWGFDKKLSVERKVKKLLRQKKSANKSRRRRGGKRSKRSQNAKASTKSMKTSESSVLNTSGSPKLAISRIDYNQEVARLVSENTLCDHTGDNWRSDKTVTSIQKEFSQSVCSIRTDGPTGVPKANLVAQQSISHEESSTLSESWLNEIWDESFDPDQYLSSTSDLFQEAPFLMESEFMNKEPPMFKTNSVNKGINEENDTSFKDLFRPL